MKNKILKLPISGGIGDVSTTNQCQGALMDVTLKRFQDDGIFAADNAG